MPLPDTGTFRPGQWPPPFDTVIASAHLAPLQTLEQLIHLQNVQQLRGQGISPARWAFLIGVTARMAMATEGGIWEGPDATDRKTTAQVCVQLALNMPVMEADEKIVIQKQEVRFSGLEGWLLQAALCLDPRMTTRSVKQAMPKSAANETLEQTFLRVCQARPDLTLKGSLWEAFSPLKLPAALRLIALSNALDTVPELSEETARRFLALAWELRPDQEALWAEWQNFRNPKPRSRKKAQANHQIRLARAALRLTQHPALRLPATTCSDAVPEWLWALRDGPADQSKLWKELNPDSGGLKRTQITESWFTGDYGAPVALGEPRALERQIKTKKGGWATSSFTPGQHLNLQNIALNHSPDPQTLLVLLRESNDRKKELNLSCHRTWQLPALSTMVEMTLHHPDLDYLREHLHYRLNLQAVTSLGRELARNELKASGYAASSPNDKNLIRALPLEMATSIALALRPLAILALRHIAGQFSQAREQINRAELEENVPNFSLPEMLLALDWEGGPADNDSRPSEIRETRLLDILIRALTKQTNE